MKLKLLGSMPISPLYGIVVGSSVVVVTKMRYRAFKKTFQTCNVTYGYKDHYGPGFKLETDLII